MMRNIFRGIALPRALIALSSGWLALLCTSYILVLDNVYDTRFVWPLFFPMLIATAWGPVYAYIAGIGGLVFLSPFLEMSKRGWGNLLIGILYLLLLLLCGHLSNRPMNRCIYYMIHVGYAAFYYVIMVTVYRYVLQFNPNGTAYQRFTSPTITKVQAITFIFGVMALVSFIKVLISLPAVRRLLCMSPLPYSGKNKNLFVISLLVVAGFLLIDWMFEAFYFENRGLHTSILSSSFNKTIKLPIVFTASCIICDAIICSTMKTLESHDKLMRSEERYRMIFQHSADAYLEIDEGGTILQVNPAINSNLGFAPDSLLGLHINRLFSDKPAINALVGTLFRGGRVNNFEIMGKLPNNESCSLLVSGNVMLLGKQRLAVLTARNISDYKKAEQKRWEMAALLQAIFESNHDFIWTVDCDTFSVISYNQAFSRYTRDVFGREVQGGSKLENIFPREDCALFVGYLQRALRKGGGSVEYKAQNSALILDINFFPVRLQDKISSIAVFARDVTAQKHAERKIVELNEGLEQMVEERTRELRTAYRDLESFSFTVTHEFRTPIREIDTYLEIIQEDNFETLTEQSQADILSARKVCHRTLDMIEKMMIYAKAGFMVLTIEKIDMNHLVRGCFNDIQQASDFVEAELTLYSLPVLYADSFLLRIAVMNVLSNSVKFSQPGKPISIVVGHMHNDTQITYYFCDNGVGFQNSPDNDLFSLFNRAHNNEYDGSGVGLALVKRILRRHGGQAEIYSEPNKGCVVFFTFHRDF